MGIVDIDGEKKESAWKIRESRLWKLPLKKEQKELAIRFRENSIFM